MATAKKLPKGKDAPVRKKSPHRVRGNPTKKGKVFGNWTERRTTK
jgi:hypothetical protein